MMLASCHKNIFTFLVYNIIRQIYEEQSCNIRSLLTKTPHLSVVSIHFTLHVHNYIYFFVGPYFFSFEIRNLHTRRIILTANFPTLKLPNIEPRQGLKREFQHLRPDPLRLMAYDAVFLQRLTLNGQNEIVIQPETRKKPAVAIAVPNKG